MKKHLLLPLLITSALVSGCAQSVSRDVSGKIDRVQALNDASFNKLGNVDAASASAVSFVDGPLLAPVSSKHNSEASFPKRLRQPGAVTLTSRDPMTLSEIASELTEITKLPHLVALGPSGNLSISNASLATADDLKVRNRTDSGASSSDISSAERFAIQAAANRASADKSAAMTTKITPNLRGSLPAVLNELAMMFQVEWEIVEGRVLLRDYVTRQYQITALPTQISATSSVGADTMSASIASASDVWGEVSKTIRGLAGDQANISIGDTSGIVTATAKVSDHDRIAKYIDQMNATMGQQVSFDINVITVSSDRNGQRGVDIAGIVNNAMNGTLQMGGAVFSGGELGSYNMGVIQDDFQVGALIRALQSNGLTATISRAGGSTSNGRILPIQNTSETPYVSAVTTSTDSDTNTEDVTRQIDVAKTGLQFQFTPRIMNPRKVNVAFSGSISEVSGVFSVGSGSDLLQKPKIARVDFHQERELRSGETLVMIGFDRDYMSVSSQGGVDGMSALSASRTTEKQRASTIVLITANILRK